MAGAWVGRGCRRWAVTPVRCPPPQSCSGESPGPPSGAAEGGACLCLSKQDRLNSKKHKAKDDKKPVKSSSRDRIFLEAPAPDSTTPSQEPIDPLVMEKYTQRLHTEVRARARCAALPSLRPELCPCLCSLVHSVYSTDSKCPLHL